MSTASAALSPSAAVVACPGRRPSQEKRSAVYIGGLNSFGGLKAHNSIASLGLPACSHQSFAMVLNSLKSAVPQRKGRGGGGGALSSTCSAVAEIFKIAAIMNGLTLIGVAVGFVLLRIEASVEESE